MAYSVVPTVITGDFWTAGNNNTYIRDNWKAGIPHIFEDVGDMAYALDENSAGKLPLGTARKVLQVNDAGIAPEWTGIIGCGLYSNTGDYKNTEYYVYFTIPFDSALYDTGNFWSVDDPDAVIIPYNGVYRLSGVLGSYRLLNSGNPSGDMGVAVGPTGKVVKRLKMVPESNTSTATSFCYVGIFSAGDDVYLAAMFPPSLHNRRGIYYSVTYLGMTS